MDENKKPGQRDISDLKARLGLKKGAAAPAGGAPSVGSGTGPQPIAPSSGGTGPHETVSAPFASGAAAQPTANDPRRDPFGQQQAANLAAFYGINQAMPGTADAASDTNLSQNKGGTRALIIVGAAVLGLIIGQSFGRIFSERLEFNASIDQAEKLNTEVQRIEKHVSEIIAAVTTSTQKSHGGVDTDLAATLGGLVPKDKPDTLLLFHSNYAHMDPVAVDRLFTYFNDATVLFREIESHKNATLADKETINSAAKSIEEKNKKKYAIILDLSKPVGLSQLVELGDVVCNTPGQKDCNAAELKGFQYRVASSGNWSERPAKGKPEQVVYPLQPTPFFESILSGNPDVLVLRDYGRRMQSIGKLASEIDAVQKQVVADMKKSAERPRLFAF